MVDYLALIHLGNGTGYAVRFPDFPTVTADGETIEEARRAAQEALSAHIAFMIDEGLAVPEPSSLDTVMKAPRNRDAVAVLLPVPALGKPVRVSVTLDERLLQEIDALSVLAGLPRSGFVAEAVRQHIAALRQAEKVHAEVKAMKRARQRALGKRV